MANPTSCAIPAQSTDDNGSVMGVFDQDNANSSLSHTEAYSYDALNRLSTAVATGNATYNLTFSYNRWGNMACTINGQTGGPCPQYSFSSSTNRITNSGFTYDVAGSVSGSFTGFDFTGINCPSCSFDSSTLALDTGGTPPTPAATPEPGTLLLFGTALLGLLALNRRMENARAR